MLSINSLVPKSMNFRDYNPFNKERDLIRINVDYDWRFGIVGFIRRQLVVILVVVLGLLMAVPYVPGPGILTIFLALFIGNYPGKKRFIRWIRQKRWFRKGRYFLRQRYRILMVLPRLSGTKA